MRGHLWLCSLNDTLCNTDCCDGYYTGKRPILRSQYLDCLSTCNIAERSLLLLPGVHQEAKTLWNHQPKGLSVDRIRWGNYRSMFPNLYLASVVDVGLGYQRSEHHPARLNALARATLLADATQPTGSTMLGWVINASIVIQLD